MMKLSVPYLYLFMGLAVPGSVMFGARYVGQASSVTKAGTAAFEVPEMIEFPDVHLLSTGHSDAKERLGNIESPLWIDEGQYEDESDLFASLPESPRSFREEVFDGNVTSILPHPKNPMAVINSKPHRIGDELEGGWKLVGINGEDRTVILMHESGKHLVVELTKKQ